MSHTPGPWRIDYDNDDYPVIGRPSWKCRRYDVQGEWEIAKVEDLSEENDEERAANARLISAAPDLLEVVKAFVVETIDYMTLNKLGDPEQQHNVKWARSVIAKVEGRA